MPHFVQRPVHPDHGRSWMLPQAESSNVLLYVAGEGTGDEYIYDYPSGKSVGVLTGLSGPEGGCVDAKGDVYIAEFGNDSLVEFAHGGTKPINTYTPGGEPMGCSVG
jgi:hypothetical protein